MEMKENILELLEKFFNNSKLNNEESAYLAMTSKFELPLRDKLAYSLFKYFKERGTENKYVCREWASTDRRRVDIAIMETDNVPQYLIEVKATNTQHGYGGFKGKEKRLNHIRPHVKSLIKQLHGLKHTHKKSEVYGIFIGTHPQRKINEKYNVMVKSCYSSPGKKVISEIEKAYKSTISDILKKEMEKGVISYKETPIYIDLDMFYETPISLIIYIVEYKGK
jgi:hypothetical protein